MIPLMSVSHHRSTERLLSPATTSNVPLTSRNQPIRRASVPNVCPGYASAQIPPKTKRKPSSPWTHRQPGIAAMATSSLIPASSSTTAKMIPMVHDRVEIELQHEEGDEDPADPGDQEQPPCLREMTDVFADLGFPYLWPCNCRSHGADVRTGPRCSASPFAGDPERVPGPELPSCRAQPPSRWVSAPRSTCRSAATAAKHGVLQPGVVHQAARASTPTAAPMSGNTMNTQSCDRASDPE